MRVDRFITFLALACILTGTLGCRISITSIKELPGNKKPQEPEEERFYLVDATGRNWDITHAVVNYGFNPEGFSPGKGPYERPPLEEKLRYHRMRAAGEVSTWAEFERLQKSKDPAQPLVPRRGTDTIRLDDYEPPERDDDELPPF